MNHLNTVGAAECMPKEYIDPKAERTIEENIDAKIYAHRQEIARLEASKESLKPLLGIKLRDLREAASY